MKPIPPKNVAHSVRDRLFKLAKTRGEDFNFVLVRYALERLLYRVSKSPHEAELILKGAMLFTVWSKHPHRATKDLDLLGSGAPDLERLAGVFREVSALPVENDGLVFDPASVRARRIKEDAEYEGVRVTLEGKLGSAKLAPKSTLASGIRSLRHRRRSSSQHCCRSRAQSSGLTLVKRSSLKNFMQWSISASPIPNERFLRHLVPMPRVRISASGAGECNPGNVRTKADPDRKRSSLGPHRSIRTGRCQAVPVVCIPGTLWRNGQQTHAAREVVAAITPFLMPTIQAAVSGGSVQAIWAPGGPWIPQ